MQIISHKNFISVDWGTTNLRIRLVSIPSLNVVDEIVLNEGIKILYNKWKETEEDRVEYFLDVLFNNISNLSIDKNNIPPVVISGMASSSIGLKELPYAYLPFHINGKTLTVEKIESRKYTAEVYLISGVKSNKDDVIRGEEVQMVGFLDSSSQENSVVILPGTHSKHAIVDKGKIVDFKTYMTGELFDVISKHTILNSSIKVASLGNKELQSFEKGVKDSIAGNSIFNSLFGVRTNILFDKMSFQENYLYLSGLLIGEELSTLKQIGCDSIKLCASGKLFDLYYKALEVLELQHKTQVYSKQEVDLSVVKGQWKIFNCLQN